MRPVARAAESHGPGSGFPGSGRRHPRRPRRRSGGGFGWVNRVVQTVAHPRPHRHPRPYSPPRTFHPDVSVPRRPRRRPHRRPVRASGHVGGRVGVGVHGRARVGRGGPAKRVQYVPVRVPGQVTGLWGAPSAVAHSYLHPESLRVSRPYRAPRPHGFNLERAIGRYGSRFIRRNVIPAVTTRRGAFRAGQRVQAYGSLGKSIGQSLTHEAMLQGALRQYHDRQRNQFTVGPATISGLPGIIGADIGRELHGQGVIAQAGAKAGDWVARNLPLASARGDVGGFTKRYGRAFVHDLFNLPGEAIPPSTCRRRSSLPDIPGRRSTRLASRS
jgi:hypothetical protein